MDKKWKYQYLIEIFAILLKILTYDAKLNFAKPQILVRLPIKWLREIQQRYVVT